MLWLELAASLAAIGLFATLAWAAASFAPWVPARRRDLERIARLAALQPGETLYELGAGNGRVSLALARHFPDSRIVGLELAWPLFALCRARQWLCRTRNVRFRWRNLFRTDLGAADVVYFFGVPKTVTGPLQEKLRRELKPGARVLSYAFELQGWEAEAVDQPTPQDISVYRYRM